MLGLRMLWFGSVTMVSLPMGMDQFYSIIQQYVLSAYYVPDTDKKCLGTGSTALDKGDKKSLSVRSLYFSGETVSKQNKVNTIKSN